MQNIENFFEYALERHAIYHRRELGVPRSKLTNDPILKQYRFCNVFRELDTTTVWFRENVRERLTNQPEVLLATVLFRWFNRISAGEAIFNQTYSLGSQHSNWTSFDQLLEGGPEAVIDVRSAVLQYCGNGPYVTGSYIIKTRDGMNKVDGILWAVREFMRSKNTFDKAPSMGWREVGDFCLDHNGGVRLEVVWDWLRKFQFIGDFMAYEIVSDLRHTALLHNAPDINRWANPGPGALRGLNRIHDRPLEKKMSKEDLNIEMRNLLSHSRHAKFWPTRHPMWDMRTVEHTLCEFDKYERVRLGQGAPKQKFKP